MRMNGLPLPKWLYNEYAEFEQIQRGGLGSILSSATPAKSLLPLSRADKLIYQKYIFMHPNEKIISNSILDGFRLDMEFPDIKLNIELDGPSHRLFFLLIFFFNLLILAKI
jgi:hypothetical protein